VRWEGAVAARRATSASLLIFTRRYRVSQGFFRVFVKSLPGRNSVRQREAGDWDSKRLPGKGKGKSARFPVLEMGQDQIDFTVGVVVAEGGFQILDGAGVDIGDAFLQIPQPVLGQEAVDSQVA